MAATPVYSVTAEALNAFQDAVRRRESARSRVERAMDELDLARAEESKAVEALDAANGVLRRDLPK